MKIVFNESTKKEYSKVYNFLYEKVNADIKTFKGTLNENGYPVGACELDLEFDSNNKKSVRKIMFTLDKTGVLNGPAVAYLINEQIVNYNFMEDNFGEIFYENNAYYIGEIRNFQREGEGSYTDKNGVIFEGPFVNNLRHGEFTMKFKDETSSTVNFFNGKMNGTLVKDMPGDIKMYAILKDNTITSIEYVYYTEKENYKILFKMLRSENPFYTITGNTEIYYNDELVYKGDIVDGKRQGKGIFYHSDGTMFEGEYQNDKCNGYGILKDINDKVIQKGYWKDDKYIGETENNIQVVEQCKAINLQNIVELKTAMKKIEENIVGQEGALNAILNNILLSCLCPKDSTKPLTSVLMTGPTGVGKTETAKQISYNLFGKSPYVVDFSTFFGEHMLASLIGAPAGYKGFDEEPAFLKYIRENAETGGVLLFDELDKADEECYNIFMRMLDEGEIISAKNEVFNISNFIIIGTTNMSANHTRKLGFSSSDENDVKDTLVKSQTGMRKEFLARYAVIAEYTNLTKENKMELCKRAIDDTINKVLKIDGYKIQCRYSKSIIEKIVDKSNVSFGVREIKKQASKVITSKLAEFIRHNDSKDVIVEINSLEDIKIIDKEKRNKTVEKKQKEKQSKTKDNIKTLEK